MVSSSPILTVTHMVERSVREFPGVVAIEVAGEEVTYAELWRLAGVLAADILAAAQDPARIAVFCTRSKISYLGYLAALRLGATVVPLHPDVPIARTIQTMHQAGLDAVVVDGEIDAGTADVLSNAGYRLVRFSGNRAPIARSAETDWDDDAYILFTSGSTGVPKGVPISHRSVAAYVEHVVRRYKVTVGCRLTQNFDLTFDPSVFDLLASWSSGATLVVADRQELLFPVKFVNRKRITHWFSVPSLISHARRLRSLRPGVMPDLRWSAFIGEALTQEQAAAWHAAAPSSVIENVYGPTELTVSCTEFRLPPHSDEWPSTSNGTVPIGNILPGLEWMLVDEDGRRGTYGELCVRGIQRFSGYLDPADNIDRFVSYGGDGDVARRYDGTEPLTPAHWYRTGDRVRVEDGPLVHLGRIDRQVKLSGYRVELGEIEAAIRRLPGILDAAIVMHEDERSLDTLTAWYVGDGEVADLESTLAQRLPRYMIPARFVRLSEMPLNRNAKTDYLQLTALATGRPGTERPVPQAADIGRGKRLPWKQVPALELVRQTVERVPDRIAVESDGVTYTFAELWRRAGRVAEQLRERGVRRNEPIGVAMGRGPALLPALIGIWRAEAAYVPLDPRWPEQRRDLVLSEVSRHGLRHVLEDSETDGGEPSVSTVAPLDEAVPPSDGELLAYVMFTSGSTGRPKGTAVTQRSVSAFVQALEDVFAPAADEVMVATTALSFDISVLELFWPLVGGRTVLLLPTITDRAVGAFAAAAARDTPKMLQLTPSTAALVDLPERLTRTRILIGGEPLPRAQAAQLAERCDHLYNMYGPTEATVWVTWHEVRADEPGAPVVRLGRPLPNCDVILLDGAGNVVPPGEEGEIYLGGPQVARGYLSLPPGAASPFLDTVAGLPGPWYRTGDHGRWEDHALEFLGRRDDQVKIAGNRVELGEIEAVLREHDRVAEAVVVYAPRNASHPQLHAFVTVRPPSERAQRSQADRLVRDWVDVFEHEFKQPREGSVWRSAVDSRPIPADQIAAWHDALADQIHRLGARNVLDVGCGHGDLFARLADRCDAYLGLEPAENVVERLRTEFGGPTAAFQAAYAHEIGSEKVRRILADVMAPSGDPDCVVLNSVIQYFPSLDYLTGVLDDAYALVGIGGHVVIGDVRSLPLLERYERWLRSVGSVALTDDNTELCIDPLFFRTYARSRPDVTVWLAPRITASAPELTDFRFDVTLSRRPPAADPPYKQLSYAEAGGDAVSLRGHLEKAHADGHAVAIVGIPHGRHRGSAMAGDPMTPGQLVELLDGIPDARVGVDPRTADEGGLLVSYRPGGRHDWSEIAAEWPDPAEFATRPHSTTDRIAVRRALTAFAADRLPGHMVPAHFHVLGALPLNTSGKADRPALYALAADLVTAPPRTGKEVTAPVPADNSLAEVSTIVGDVVGTVVGPDDDLLDAGMNSLKAAQIARGLWHRFGGEIAPGDVLRHRTCRALATLCARGKPGASAARLTGPGAALSLAQRSMVAWAMRYPKRHDLMFLLRWRVSGPVRTPALEEAVEALGRRHPILSSALSRRGEMVPVTGAAPRIRRLPAGGDTEEPPKDLLRCFDITTEPPVRWALRRGDDGTTGLFAVLHHLVFDDAAIHLLHRDLIRFYAEPPQESGDGHPKEQHDDAVAMELGLLRDRAAAERSFWAEREGSFTEGLSFAHLPASHDGTPTRRYSFEVHGGPAGLYAAARRCGVTPFVLFMTLTTRVLAGLERAGAVTAGVPVTSRNRIGADECMACFVNMVPLLVRVDETEPLEQAAQQIGRDVLEALDHSLLPVAEIRTLAGMHQDEAGAAAVAVVCQLEEALTPRTAGDVTFTPALSPSLDAMYPLFVRGETTEKDFTVHVDVGRDALTEEWAKRLGTSLLQELQAVVHRG